MCANDECETMTAREALYIRLDEEGVAVWLRSRAGWSYRLPNGDEGHGFVTKANAARAAARLFARVPQVSA